MADPAPSEKAEPSSDPPPARAGDGPKADASKVDAEAFTNTRQHVADRQAEGGAVERFTNTKLNIALINDPKNGPRFTMTKRESGLSEQDAEAPASTDSPATAAAKDTAGQATTETAPDGGPPANGKTAPSSPVEAPKASPETAPATGAKPGLPGTPPGAEPPDKLPIDSSKTFVGPNGTYYDESWRWMDWRGTRRSWNWPAALSFGHWFAYRRLNLAAGLHLLWLAGLAAAAVNGVPILAVVLLGLLGTALAGLYGNTLYFLAFRRAVDHVTQKGEGSYEELHDQLAAAGGTSAIATAWMGVLSVAAIVAALTLTQMLRGGLAISFWPFL